MSNQNAPTPPEESRVRKLLRKLRRRHHGREGFWRAHIGLFASVNGFLAFLNLVTSSSQPWVLYVLGAMSIPLGLHAVLRARRNALQASLEQFTQTPALPASDESDDPDELRRPRVNDVAVTDVMGREIPHSVFRPLRKLHRSRTAFLSLATVGATTSAYLFLINAVGGGQFWSIIPAASIAFPLAFWGVLLRNRRRKLRAQLERAQSAAPLTAPVATSALPSGTHQASLDAREVRAKIVELVEAHAPGRADLVSRIDSIIAEIDRLAGLERGFDEALSILPIEDLEREQDELVSQRDSAEHAMRAHYDESLSQLRSQIESLRDLRQKREMVSIRLRSGVNSLRQVSLDLVRIKGDQTLSQLDDRIGEQAEELSRYFGDLRSSYDELSREIESLGQDSENSP